MRQIHDQHLVSCTSTVNNSVPDRDLLFRPGISCCSHNSLMYNLKTIYISPITMDWNNLLQRHSQLLFVALLQPFGDVAHINVFATRTQC